MEIGLHTADDGCNRDSDRQANRMTDEMALRLGTQMLWHALLLAGPVLLATVGVGVAVSLVQVITQIQDASLAFVPKIIAVAAVIWLMGPWMLKTLLAYATTLIGQIPLLFHS